MLLILITTFFIISSVQIFSQSIENVDFRAEGKSIVVTYDFLHPKADTSVNIELQFKDQQGSVITPKTISGDLKDVKPGQEKRIIWDVIADGIILSGKYKAELNIIQYNSVKIGNQVWMTENLNVDRFRNGELIPEAKTKEEWIKAGENKQPAWCYYNNDPSNGKKYGKLYNWYAVSDSRGLAPENWRIPSDKEWVLLVELVYKKKKYRNGNKFADTLNSISFEKLILNRTPGWITNTGLFQDYSGYSDILDFVWNVNEKKITNMIIITRNMFVVSPGKKDFNKKMYGYNVICIKDF